MFLNSKTWMLYAQVPLAPLGATLTVSDVVNAVPMKPWQIAVFGFVELPPSWLLSVV